jgi:hypothetical protein
VVNGWRCGFNFYFLTTIEQRDCARGAFVEMGIFPIRICHLPGGECVGAKVKFHAKTPCGLGAFKILLLLQRRLTVSLKRKRAGF